MSGNERVRGVRQAGDRAVLLELDDSETVRRVHAELSDDPVDGIDDLVPGARTLLVIASHPGSRALAVAVQRAQGPVGTVSASSETTVVRLQVRYDGTDLAEVASRCGMSVEEVISRHSSRAYTAAFFGLVPGFAYLTGLDPALRLPRRDSPRTSVPAGSLAMASEFTGVYPRSSPGGWHLLGSTTTPLWDLERQPPALLAPGTTVRFEPIR